MVELEKGRRKTVMRTKSFSYNFLSKTTFSTKVIETSKSELKHFLGIKKHRSQAFIGINQLQLIALPNKNFWKHQSKNIQNWMFTIKCFLLSAGKRKRPAVRRNYKLRKLELERGDCNQNKSVEGCYFREHYFVSKKYQLFEIWKVIFLG